MTGAGRGLGAAIGRRLHVDGAAVLLCDIDEAAVERLAHELGGGAAAAPLDVRDEQQWQAAVGAATALGDLYALVNCAARTDVRDCLSISVAEWDDVLAVNLRGPCLGIRTIGPLLHARAGPARSSMLPPTRRSGGVASPERTMRRRRQV